MDDPRTVETAPQAYRCPGQAYPIDRGVHLRRLATFYSGCLGCDHRHDNAGLSPLQLRAWAQLERRTSTGPKRTPEGWEGTSAGDVDAALVEQVAHSVAGWLWQRAPRAANPPEVLVGTDGSCATAELLPVACRALQLAGCRGVEIGAVTSPALAAAAHRRRAAAALWIGPSSAAPHAASIKLWQGRGVPASSPGALDEIWAVAETGAPRPNRGGGQLARSDALAEYLPPLESLFHGLRPLVIVLDTTCEVLVRCWQRLAAASACRLLRPCGNSTGSNHPAADGAFVDARLELLGREVVGRGAHLGIWIDGDGERCRLFDERGLPVAPEALFLVLAESVARGQPGATVVVEPMAGNALVRSLERRGLRAIRGEATRQGMCQRMQQSRAVLGGGASGRHWFSGPPPASDALLSLSLLVSILSQSDRPLSEVLDAVQTAG